MKPFRNFSGPYSLLYCFFRKDNIPSHPKLLVINEDEIDANQVDSETCRPKRPHSQPPGRTRKSKGNLI